MQCSEVKLHAGTLFLKDQPLTKHSKVKKLVNILGVYYPRRGFFNSSKGRLETKNQIK